MFKYPTQVPDLMVNFFRKGVTSDRDFLLIDQTLKPRLLRSHSLAKANYLPIDTIIIEDIPRKGINSFGSNLPLGHGRLSNACGLPGEEGWVGEC